ncbi:hypothetical protein [Nocardioides acrostichi]|uniref:Uncharacterized protein n=1 Tax=Nocardioides acrostichi TaxID=2784339 RepID=A0A930Y704_9ACTN|nr:hypothetical protein [Nocardioides acrostichi]MBF4161542.1 hypothetical protein [Nocardioides acrostichi]
MTGFGDSATLRRFASTTRQDAEDTELTGARAQRRMDDVHAAADHYERASAAALAGRWSDAHSVVTRMVSDAYVVADGVDRLAGTLDRCETRWRSLWHEALSEGFDVSGIDEGVVVTAPAETGTDDGAAARHADKQRRAAALEGQLRDAAREADAARRSLESEVHSHRPGGLGDFDAGNGPVPAIDTGDASLDAALRDFLGPVSGVHRLFREGH